MPQFIDQHEQAPQVLDTPWTKLLAQNKDKGSVIYYFASETCKFCDAAKPWIDAIERKYAENGLTILGVDINRSPSIAGSAGVTGVPVLIMTQGGEPINRVVGWANDMDLEIEANLGLLDLYGKKPGLRGQSNEIRNEANNTSTCEGCDKPENDVIAELSQNITRELEEIRKEIASVREQLDKKADR